MQIFFALKASKYRLFLSWYSSFTPALLSMTIYPLRVWSYKLGKQPFKLSYYFRPMYNFLPVGQICLAHQLSSASRSVIHSEQTLRADRLCGLQSMVGYLQQLSFPQFSLIDNPRPSNCHYSATADATLTEVLADTTLTSSPCH